MLVQNHIESKLREGLPTDFLEVVNESHMHSVPPNSETHFRVTLVSSAFVDTRSVARHQQVYGLLREELQGGVHALALHTYTPDEWSERQQQTPDSPQCLGGSKPDK